MSILTTRAFWEATAERAAKTFAQVGAVVLGAEAVEAGGFDVLAADWLHAGSLAAGGAVLSVLMSIASARLSGDGPSLTNAETPTR